MFKSDQAVQLKGIMGGRGFTKREKQSKTHTHKNTKTKKSWQSKSTRRSERLKMIIHWINVDAQNHIY